MGCWASHECMLWVFVISEVLSHIFIGCWSGLNHWAFKYETTVGPICIKLPSRQSIFGLGISEHIQAVLVSWIKFLAFPLGELSCCKVIEVTADFSHSHVWFFFPCVIQWVSPSSVHKADYIITTCGCSCGSLHNKVCYQLGVFVSLFRWAVSLHCECKRVWSVVSADALSGFCIPLLAWMTVTLR